MASRSLEPAGRVGTSGVVGAAPASPGDEVKIIYALSVINMCQVMCSARCQVGRGRENEIPLRLKYSEKHARFSSLTATNMYHENLGNVILRHHSVMQEENTCLTQRLLPSPSSPSSPRRSFLRHTRTLRFTPSLLFFRESSHRLYI